MNGWGWGSRMLLVGKCSVGTHGGGPSHTRGLCCRFRWVSQTSLMMYAREDIAIPQQDALALCLCTGLDLTDWKDLLMQPKHGSGMAES